MQNARQPCGNHAVERYRSQRGKQSLFPISAQEHREHRNKHQEGIKSVVPKQHHAGSGKYKKDDPTFAFPELFRLFTQILHQKEQNKQHTGKQSILGRTERKHHKHRTDAEIQAQHNLPRLGQPLFSQPFRTPCEDTRHDCHLAQGINGDTYVVTSRQFIARLYHTAQKQHMKQWVMRGEIAGHHLIHLLHGVIHKEPGVYRQKDRQITQENDACKNQDPLHTDLSIRNFGRLFRSAPSRT